MSATVDRPRLWESNISFKRGNSLRLAGSPPPCRREAWVSALLHKLVGVGAYDDPRSWESNFTYERSQRLLRRSLRAKALGFVRSAMLHFQNFVSLALAQDDVLRGVRGGLMLRNTVFIQTSVPSSTTQSAVPLPLRGRLVLCPPTQVGA